MKLSIVLATRKRPGLLSRTVTETLKHIRHPETKLVIVCDDDDDGTLSMRDALNDPRIVWSVEPRPDSLGEKYNRVMRVAPADVYMVMVDYAPCVTDGFDERVIDAAQVYPDGYAVILGHLANLSFSSINGVTHKLAEKMGGIYPEHFPYWFIDHWLEDVAKQIGRQVFVDALIDCSKRPGTMDKREPGFWGVLFDWLHMERRRIAQDIITSPDFDETAARKAALLRNYPLVEEWSVIINSMTRNDPGVEVDANDERYARIRQRANETIKSCVAVAEKAAA